jgi:hypothetical protein
MSVPPAEALVSQEISFKTFREVETTLKSQQLDFELSRVAAYQKQADACVCKKSRSRDDEVTLTDGQMRKDFAPGEHLIIELAFFFSESFAFTQDLKRRKGISPSPLV